MAQKHPLRDRDFAAQIRRKLTAQQKADKKAKRLATRKQLEAGKPLRDRTRTYAGKKTAAKPAAKAKKSAT